MRTILKHFILDTVSLYIVSQIVSGMIFADGLFTLLVTGVVLTLTTMIIKPVINILLLPINLVTFGIFKWLGFAITFYLVTLIVPGFKIAEFLFKGYNTYWVSIPALSLSGVLAIVAFSFLISIISSVSHWIFK